PARRCGARAAPRACPTRRASDLAAASRLGFTVQPTNATAGVAIAPAVQVAVEDAFGNTVTSSTASITLAIGTNPGGGALSGTTAAPAGTGVASSHIVTSYPAGAG